MRFEDIQTFLEVAAVGQFGRAAARLNVTQSTVSMRIQALEEDVDAHLFTRGRGGAHLTPAGERFHRYALSMSQLWQDALKEVAIPSGYRTSFGLGAQVSLWERLIVRWIPWMRAQVPDVALRIEAAYSDTLMDHLSAGLLQLGVMYGPRHLPGLVVQTLMEEKLILISTKQRHVRTRLPEDYVYVDWGETFRAAHDEAFSRSEPAGISVSLGAVGLRYIVAEGGSGYFPVRVVRSLLADGTLFRVPGAPVFRRPVYMVYPEERRDAVVDLALDGLTRIAALESEEE